MEDVEIEIKIKPKKSEVFTTWLKKNAKLIKSSHQVDYYFNPPHKDFLFKDKSGNKTADD
jgi:adenylate cyclase class IV